MKPLSMRPSLFQFRFQSEFDLCFHQFEKHSMKIQTERMYMSQSDTFAIRTILSVNHHYINNLLTRCFLVWAFKIKMQWVAMGGKSSFCNDCVQLFRVHLFQWMYLKIRDFETCLTWKLKTHSRIGTRSFLFGYIRIYSGSVWFGLPMTVRNNAKSVDFSSILKIINNTDCMKFWRLKEIKLVFKQFLPINSECMWEKAILVHLGSLFQRSMAQFPLTTFINESTGAKYFPNRKIQSHLGRACQLSKRWSDSIRVKKCCENFLQWPFQRTI